MRAKRTELHNSRATSATGARVGAAKRKAARASKGLHALPITYPREREVFQFAANLTVHLLPPDVVCLYSEDRKFFLHGELYYAMAPAIAAGQSVQKLVCKLEQNFPSDKIYEALQRLRDRRFIVPKSSSYESVAAAYWSSLGLSPGTAEKNLKNVRVRVHSIDVQGLQKLSDALRELGVRLTKRSADLPRQPTQDPH